MSDRLPILVTGSNGFIGQHLCPELESHGYEIVRADLKRDPLLEDVSRRENLERLLADHQVGTVIHLAAKVGRLFGEDDVAQTVADNAGMTTTIAKFCGDHGLHLVYASTSEIYGDCGSTIAYEAMSPRMPHNIYGLSKRWGEEACQLYAPNGLNILRFSMPYGPGLLWGRGRAALINFIYAALQGEPITVHRDSERSWCWIGDTVRAVRLILEREEEGAYNVGRDDNALAMETVARMVCYVTDADPALINVVDAPGRQTVVKRLATHKLRGLGWTPEVQLEEGIERCRDWIVEQLEVGATAG